MQYERVLNCLNLGSSLESLLLLQNLHLGLGAHDTTTPLSAGLVVLVHEAILDGRDELGELSLVLGADLGEGEDGSGLQSNLLVYTIHLLHQTPPDKKKEKRTFLWTTVPRRALPLTMA